MKQVLDICYIIVATLLLAIIFTSLEYSFGEAFFLGSFFMPGAFLLKYFMPQLSFSNKGDVANLFYLFSSVVILTFLFVVVFHMAVLKIGDLQMMLLNPVFILFMLILIVIGDHCKQKVYDKYLGRIPESVSFVSERRKITLLVSDIVYIESNDRDVYIHTNNKVLFRNKTPISQWERVLGEQFIRTHRAFLLNKTYVAAVKNDFIRVEDENIPVSRKYKKAVDTFFVS